MTTVAIVYHSGFGHTKVIADSVSAGAAQVDGVTVSVLTVADAMADLDQLDAIEAIIFGTPTYMGGPSAQFKAFADASSRKWATGAWRDKIAAAFTVSLSLSGDKHMTLSYLVTFAMQHKMLWIGQAEPGPTNDGDQGGKPEDVNRIGSYTGLMAQADNVAPEISPPSGDHETARLFGERIGMAARRWARDD
jgi:NAD(P)H dehydrogenase (quinone)